MTTLTIGTTCQGFVVQHSEIISEINSTVSLFTHKTLGCQALAIKNSDPNKTFCVAFRTIPEDSTGVAHILEHSVLMGSEKYPIKDVFGEINKGGLMTFLNAMTGSDTTWYPFATRNLREYFNIMDVYCDVVFNPLLLRSTFEQEGWHFHQEDLNAPLQYTGVVFNEMKGAFSDPIRTLFHHTYSGLMPGSTYSHESGGDPRHIPDLTYEQFLAFHRLHYHPSNCTFFFYGDAPLEDELAFVQNMFLERFPSPVPRASIVAGEDIHHPLVIEDTYPVQPGTPIEEKTFIAVSSIVGTVRDRKRNTAFQIIANILFNSDASPLKNAIFSAGLCKDFGGLFLTNSSLKTVMITYLVGSDQEKKETFVALYNQTLAEMVASGLDQDLVRSELNKHEFAVREEMNKAQRGLDLISKALPAMKHDLSPFEALQMEHLLAEIRKMAVEEGYFERLISAHLLNNPATVTVTLTPDPEKTARMTAEEKHRLEAHAQSLSQEDLQELVHRTRELLALQATPNTSDQLLRLPRLALADLDYRPSFFTAEALSLDHVPLLVSELETSGISYIDLGLDCSRVPVELLPYLDLFGTIITEIGTTSKNYMQFAKAINLAAGGFEHSFQAYIQANGQDRVRPVLWLHLKALSTSLDQSTDLVAEVLAAVDFSDRRRIQEIVQREYAWAEHSVQSEGYALASTRAFSHLSRAGRYNEHVHGVEAYLHLKRLATDYSAGEEELLAALQTLRDLLFRRDGAILAITAENRDIARFQELGGPLIAVLPQTTATAIPEVVFPASPACQAFTTSAEIVYNVQACNLFNPARPYTGSFEVLRTWLSRDYLWNTVRQMGGAYGCFVQFNHLSGNFGMVSYRDPQVRKTFETYQALPEVIAGLDLTDDTLVQLIIGAYSHCTPHQGPAARGASARNDYLSGVSPAFKQQRINDILTTTVADLRGYSDLFATLARIPYRASIGNTEKIRADGSLFDTVLDI